MQFDFFCVKIAPEPRKKDCKILYSGSGSGDIAQLVEQMTFNHWVQGSSPCVPTRKITTACRSCIFLPGARTRTPKGFGTKRSEVKGAHGVKTNMGIHSPCVPTRKITTACRSFCFFIEKIRIL